MKSINDFDSAVLGFIIAGLAYILNMDLSFSIKVIIFAFAIPFFLIIASFVAYAFEWESNISHRVFSIMRKVRTGIRKNRRNNNGNSSGIHVHHLLAGFCLLLIFLFAGCQLISYRTRLSNGILDKAIKENAVIASINGIPVSFSLQNVTVNRQKATYTATFLSEGTSYILVLELPALLNVGSYKMDRYTNSFQLPVNLRFSNGTSEYGLTGLSGMCALDLTYHDKNRTRYQGKLQAVLCLTEPTHGFLEPPLILELLPSDSHSKNEEKDELGIVAIFDEFDFSTQIEITH